MWLRSVDPFEIPQPPAVQTASYLDTNTPVDLPLNPVVGLTQRGFFRFARRVAPRLAPAPDLSIFLRKGIPGTGLTTYPFCGLASLCISHLIWAAVWAVMSAVCLSA